MFFTVALLTILWIALCVHLARGKNRSAGGWAFAGFLFGIFAVIFLLFLPTIEEKPQFYYRRDQ